VEKWLSIFPQTSPSLGGFSLDAPFIGAAKKTRYPRYRLRILN
jgi:hypothetical protein